VSSESLSKEKQEYGSILEQCWMHDSSVPCSVKGWPARSKPAGLISKQGFGADRAEGVTDLWPWSYRNPDFLISTLPFTSDLERDLQIL